MKTSVKASPKIATDKSTNFGKCYEKIKVYRESDCIDTGSA
jgi:hypothetical protein